MKSSPKRLRGIEYNNVSVFRGFEDFSQSPQKRERFLVTGDIEEPNEDRELEETSDVLEKKDPEPKEKPVLNSYLEEQIKQILNDARAEAKAIREEAREEGFEEGRKEGIRIAYQEGQEALERQEELFLQQLKHIIEGISEEKKKFLQKHQKDLAMLSLSIAEKIIQKSLQEDSSAIENMILSATDKINHREWAKIYISQRDASLLLNGDRDFLRQIEYLSDHIKIIPMNTEEGTCIVELPERIIDASVDTQMENVKKVLQGSI